VETHCAKWQRNKEVEALKENNIMRNIALSIEECICFDIRIPLRKF